MVDHDQSGSHSQTVSIWLVKKDDKEKVYKVEKGLMARCIKADNCKYAKVSELFFFLATVPVESAAPAGSAFISCANCSLSTNVLLSPPGLTVSFCICIVFLPVISVTSLIRAIVTPHHVAAAAAEKLWALERQGPLYDSCLEWKSSHITVFMLMLPLSIHHFYHPFLLFFLFSWSSYSVICPLFFTFSSRLIPFF